MERINPQLVHPKLGVRGNVKRIIYVFFTASHNPTQPVRVCEVHHGRLIGWSVFGKQGIKLPLTRSAVVNKLLAHVKLLFAISFFFLLLLYLLFVGSSNGPIQFFSIHRAPWGTTARNHVHIKFGFIVISPSAVRVCVRV